ncbi:MAG: MBL fold metallo-hydrolase [Candidatus Aenigmarchaeota archaeon]|nr:MBL fold metallo-hydrolase [Candidatus Aenigmarchaeota archaeon]
MNTKIKFIGIGGGRRAMLTQKIKTGGIYIELNKNNINTNFFLDPGVGAFTGSIEQKIKFSKVDALLISHCHTDHINDAPVIIEAMTNSGRKKRAGLYASKLAIEYISQYHKNCFETVKTIKTYEQFQVNNIQVNTTKTSHTEKYNIGFIFDGVIGYTSDTTLSDKISEQYKNLDVLILNVCFFKNPYKGRDFGYGQHLDAYDAVRFLKIAKPKTCILYHIGVSILNYGFEKTRRYIQINSGIKTIIPTIGKTYKYQQK